uniref:AN1-type domain-containing protein n=1 Tax=Mesocestoides corti TaxID=53468 RepID=A0A5K3EF29_MESCO
MNNKTPEVESEAAAGNLCKRGCGFYGSVQFKDMCSKCYQEFLKNEEPAQTSKNVPGAYAPLATSQSTLLNDLDMLKKTSLPRSGTFSCKRKISSADSSVSFDPHESDSVQKKVGVETATSKNTQRTVNRCLKCRKRVGLTGFQCRCEGLFCAFHRYSDQHDCTFDYRQQGQEQIARDNPEVRCPKIRKI